MFYPTFTSLAEIIAPVTGVRPQKNHNLVLDKIVVWDWLIFMRIYCALDIFAGNLATWESGQSNCI